MARIGAPKFSKLDKCALPLIGSLGARPTVLTGPIIFFGLGGSAMVLDPDTVMIGPIVIELLTFSIGATAPEPLPERTGGRKFEATTE